MCSPNIAIFSLLITLTSPMPPCPNFDMSCLICVTVPSIASSSLFKSPKPPMSACLAPTFLGVTGSKMSSTPLKHRWDQMIKFEQDSN
ncbi:hypothetical protein VTI28DRAFT_5490 [Corynascus sepedonium]